MASISLTKSLEAYRVLSAPREMGAKASFGLDDPSDDNILNCNKFEVGQWSNRMKSIPITISPKVSGFKGGDFMGLGSLLDIKQILTDPSNACPVDRTAPTLSPKDQKALKAWKMSRKLIYSTSDGRRPVRNSAYASWNGFQVIDMDIHNYRIAKRLKFSIFRALKKCNWFYGVTFSSSMKGLHIYTKIAVPDDVHGDVQKARLLFWTNFRHKYSFVYIACLSAIKELEGTEDEFSEEDLIKWMDFAMMRPTQGAFIGYDSTPYINARFAEDFIYICFDNIEDTGHPEIDWVTYPKLRQIFQRQEFFADVVGDTPTTDILNEKDENGHLTDQVSVTGQKIHYKHAERWKLANTLVNLYGIQKGYSYLRAICSNDVKDKELQADCQTAARYNKDADIWAVNRLNKNHGFHIKMKIGDKEIAEAELLNTIEGLTNPNIIRPSEKTVTFHIGPNQFLGNILNDIMSAVAFERITLIEAGPGLGKTEMVKRIVKNNKKVMLVMPFTSTIKSKVEKEEGWYYSYGSRMPKLDVEKGLALTLDKFSRLNTMDIKAHGFDYIFLDESHLLFMSEYRNIMAKVVDMIKNTEVPVIMMSGTPTGELVFFEGIKHIRIIKKETRKKELNVFMVDNTSNLMFHMCRAMANSIANGRKVLYPSNEGMTHAKRIKAGISWFLQNEHQDFHDLRLEYYKKSQIGEQFMDDVNFHQTIGETEVLMCSSYLSVGVDILDRFDFDIYFGDLCTAAEADQWANRLRNNDLLIQLYIAKADADGNPRYIDRYKPLDMKLDEEEIKDMHSILRICNASLERNPIITKYNTLVSSILSSNNYIEFDPITQKYHINELAYKLVQFEHKVRDYQQQLPVFMKGMEAYGYSLRARDLGEFKIEGAEMFSNLKDMIKNSADEYTKEKAELTAEFLDFISTHIEAFRTAMGGHMDFYKSRTKWEVDEKNNRILVKSIEIAERITPMFLSLNKQYEPQEVREIFDFCRRSCGSYNLAAVNRIRALVNLTKARNEERLDWPIEDYMAKIDEFLDDHENGICQVGEKNEFIKNFCESYATNDSKDEVQIGTATVTIGRMMKVFEDIFRCIVKVGRPNKKKEITLEKVDLLWQTRDDKFLNPMKGFNYNLAGFMADAISVTTSTFANLTKEDEIDTGDIPF